MLYPKWKYHPEKKAIIVPHEDAEKELGSGWYNSPREFGIETCPSKVPDPEIAKIREEFLAKQAASFREEAESIPAEAAAQKKPRKAKA